MLDTYQLYQSTCVIGAALRQLERVFTMRCDICMMMTRRENLASHRNSQHPAHVGKLFFASGAKYVNFVESDEGRTFFLNIRISEMINRFDLIFLNQNENRYRRITRIEKLPLIQKDDLLIEEKESCFVVRSILSVEL